MKLGQILALFASRDNTAGQIDVNFDAKMDQQLPAGRLGLHFISNRMIIILIQFLLVPVMYICVCAAVSDKAIRAAVAEGANTLDDLRIDLGVAMNCGSCASAAEDVICAAKARLVHVDELMQCAPVYGESANEGGVREPAPGHLSGRRPRVWPIFEIA